MKFLTVTFCLLFAFMLFSCESEAIAEEEIVSENSAKVASSITYVFDENGKVTEVCITCDNGFQYCCDSPKSPNVSCPKKTGSCN